ncbi:replication-associated recombination protein A [Rothia sp. (in: high G+C Gram-positive bacteria)]|uniref:replication-associated recombination protein A n=1 Tax=Rothia sp. (in: high G+C Gram-positive bacteria) TaxID=1885016 RepID=UPI001CB0605C|nr:replication-associated recombination protein A [Rothia sp. (in: high G+C Gram-positive bacteria)]MBF1668665.1 replication-associated recombination protein A [Rothia sp. (in: high G+C Gram-positive bacteria)]
MADSLFDLELPDDGDRVSLIGASSEEPSSRTSAPRGHSSRSASRAPLAVRMRPRTIDEVLGQEHLLTPGAPLRVLAGENAGPAGPSSVILYGPPGTGKTTLAHVIARAPGRKFVELSAITAGVKDVRAVMDQALLDRDMYGTTTVLFLDEIHRFTKAQQDALLPGVENRWVILVAATTENPSFSIISPLLSRSLLLRVHSLEQSDIERLIDRALADPRGFGGAAVIDADARAHLAAVSGGDARRSLTSLEAAAAIAFSEAEQDSAESAVSAEDSANPADPANSAGQAGEKDPEPAAPVRITLAHATEAVDRAAIRYDRSGDQHYDVVSAFIKSMRGSDADAAVHYLARMLEGGEDPRFVARRIMILASEDIGLADPQALQVATAAAQSVALVGMPEARIILSQAVIYCALAPKSNAAYNAINRAIADVRAGAAGQVPVHLRDGHYAGAKQFGHGVGYVYAHDEPGHVAAQQYLPDTLRGTVYYEPTQHGFERTLTERRERIRRILDAAPVQDTTR